MTASRCLVCKLGAFVGEVCLGKDERTKQVALKSGGSVVRRFTDRRLLQLTSCARRPSSARVRFSLLPPARPPLPDTFTNSLQRPRSQCYGWLREVSIRRLSCRKTASLFVKPTTSTDVPLSGAKLHRALARPPVQCESGSHLPVSFLRLTIAHSSRTNASKSGSSSCS
jgi:hypothetical protein